MNTNNKSSNFDRIFKEVKEVELRDFNNDDIKNEELFLFQPGFVNLLKNKFSKSDHKISLEINKKHLDHDKLKTIEIYDEEMSCKNIVSDTRRVFEYMGPKDISNLEIVNDKKIDNLSKIVYRNTKDNNEDTNDCKNILTKVNYGKKNDISKDGHSFDKISYPFNLINNDKIKNDSVSSMDSPNIGYKNDSNEPVKLKKFSKFNDNNNFYNLDSNVNIKDNIPVKLKSISKVIHSFEFYNDTKANNIIDSELVVKDNIESNTDKTIINTVPLLDQNKEEKINIISLPFKLKKTTKNIQSFEFYNKKMNSEIKNISAKKIDTIKDEDSLEMNKDDTSVKLKLVSKSLINIDLVDYKDSEIISNDVNKALPENSAQIPFINNEISIDNQYKPKQRIRLVNKPKSFIFNACDLKNENISVETLIESVDYLKFSDKMNENDLMTNFDIADIFIDYICTDVNYLRPKSIMRNKTKNLKTIRNIKFADNDKLITVHVYEKEDSSDIDENFTNLIDDKVNKIGKKETDSRLSYPQTNINKLNSPSICNDAILEDVMDFKSDMLF